MILFKSACGRTHSSMRSLKSQVIYYILSIVYFKKRKSQLNIFLFFLLKNGNNKKLEDKNGDKHNYSWVLRPGGGKHMYIHSIIASYMKTHWSIITQVFKSTV